MNIVQGVEKNFELKKLIEINVNYLQQKQNFCICENVKIKKKNVLFIILCLQKKIVTINILKIKIDVKYKN